MKELQAKAKVTQTMTRDGLVVENQADGTVENVSSREAEQDYSTDAEGKAEKILERVEDIKDKHKAKKKAKQAAETAESEDGFRYRFFSLPAVKSTWPESNGLSDIACAPVCTSA